MNLKDLEQIAGKKAAQRGQAKQTALEETLHKGMTALARAKAEGYQHPGTLMNACDLLIQAISVYRQDIRAYLALAYLFAVIQDFNTAEEYIYAAIKIEPHNAELLPFLENIQGLKKDVHAAGPPAHPVLSMAPPQPPQASRQRTPNYQALYGELEAFILEKMRVLFSAGHGGIAPTVKPKTYKILLQSYKNLNQVIKYMEQQLEIIEQGLNTAPLKEKMMPFKVLKGRYVKAIQTSKQLMEINDTIELWSFKTDKQVQVVNQKLTMSALTYGRVDVDRMIDGCDLIADQLDQLCEDEKVDISLVENAYDKLVHLVESLTDMVEDSDEIEAKQQQLSDILS